jgi:hypothetical protein
VRYVAGAGSAGAAISRLVALVPKPSVNLNHYYGVIEPFGKHQVLVTLAEQEVAKGPQLAVSGDKPFQEMYFRFVAQSSRSKSIILVVTKVSSRPTGDVRCSNGKARTGRFGVDDNPGGGCCFWIERPAKRSLS